MECFDWDGERPVCRMDRADPYGRPVDPVDPFGKASACLRDLPPDLVDQGRDADHCQRNQEERHGDWTIQENPEIP